jgi:dihydroxyacetone kinase
MTGTGPDGGGVTGADVAGLIGAVRARMEAAQHQLDRLDAIAADGDHGATMVAGWRAAEAAVTAAVGRAGAEPGQHRPESGADQHRPGAGAGEHGPGRVLRDAAEAFSDVGGSIGPLWGTALLRAGVALGDPGAADLAGVRAAVAAGVAGIAERGRSREGDKTLLDVLGPASRAFCAAVDAGSDGATAALAGLAAAERGLLTSAELVPLRGRALRLASRSQGHQDPGAASAYLIWREAAIAAGAGVGGTGVAGEMVAGGACGTAGSGAGGPGAGALGAGGLGAGGLGAGGLGPVEVAG